MHRRVKLLSACITLLIGLANALPTSREINSKLIFSIPNENFENLGLSLDVLNENNQIFHECHFTEGHSKGYCEISGLPADETTIQRCNVTIDTSSSKSFDFRVRSIHRFRNNKILAIFIERKVPELITTFRILLTTVYLWMSYHLSMANTDALKI